MSDVFDPIALGGLTFKNRIVHVPTTLNMSDPMGHPNDKCVGAYESIAAGGAAAVIVGATCVRWDGLINERMLGLYDDTYVIGFRDVVEAIHNNGALAGIQLFYGGTIPGLGSTTPLEPGKGWIPNTVSHGPSAEYPIGNPFPGVLTTERYEELAEDFGQAARRAKEAGFDFVSYHFCHGSLPHTTLSLLSNVGRDDKYADRFLFCEEIIRRTQDLCGTDFPLLPRLCCDENLEGGYDIDYFVEHYAPRLAALGVAAFDCTFGSMVPGTSRRKDVHSTEFIGGGFFTPPLVNLDNIRELKRKLSERGIDMPLVGSCKVDTPDRVRTMVEDGAADFAGVSRFSLDDPDFPNKMFEGREDEIRKPTHTGASLLQGNIFGKGWAGSPQNAAFGRDREYRIRPVVRAKKVVIIGGGAGGMEYARVAKMIGHDVVLFERRDRLGGVMDWAGNYPELPNMESIRYEPEYLARQMELLKVDVRLGFDPAIEQILAEAPDTVVIATGARARLPSTPGLDAALESGRAMTIDDAMDRSRPPLTGDRILIYGAGEGMELAVNLARQGKHVRLLDFAPTLVPAPYIGSRSAAVNAWLSAAGIAVEPSCVLRAFTHEGVQVIHGARAEQLEPFLRGKRLTTTEITPDAIRKLQAEAKASALAATTGSTEADFAPEIDARDEDAGAIESIACDTVIFALGRQPNDELVASLRGQRVPVQVIGDARSPRSYGNAVHEAAYLARQL
ncbi:MAG TPA: FAD-dependent oxidoreductase [Pararhizobium sp.]|uniref:oxidoreductase n=1 Tax=Pararhizobium sp. TaxID=1977563 RepID=UPI002BAF1F64|nr:FAD-dependent oxidoreductase [Pararhizobium sp.]HTO32286.1 FAD-dependent oxidoreductase [Pararhizobium sp.]